MRLNSIMILISTVLVALTAVAKEVSFVNLTGKKYSGKDSDLEALNLKGMRIGCDSSNDREDVISWKLARNVPTGKTLESFKFNYEVLDRKGTTLTKGQQTWERMVESGKNMISGRVCWDYKASIPGNDAAILPIDVPNYAVINYWISDISIVDNANEKMKAEKAKKISDENAMASEALPAQENGCDLSRLNKCSDYSKNVSFGPLKIGEKSDIESYAKKEGYLLKIAKFEMDARYLFYKSEAAKRNSASYITVYTDSKGVVRYFAWTDGKDSMSWHATAMRKWAQTTKYVFPTNDIFTAVGPDFMVEEIAMFREKYISAYVGVRPPETNPGAAEHVYGWAKDKNDKLFFDSKKECKDHHKIECIVMVKSISDLKKFDYRKQTNNQNLFTFGLRYSVKGPLYRGFIFNDMGSCYRAREVEFRMENEYGNMLQTDCVPLVQIPLK